jgi:hypothetical protein
MYNLTQTTENQISQGRVDPTTPSLDKPGDVDTLVLQVCALLPAPTQEANVEQAKHFSAAYLWRSRPTGLYRTYEHNQRSYSRKLHSDILSHGEESSVLWRAHDVCLASTSIHQRLSYLIIIIAADTNESCSAFLILGGMICNFAKLVEQCYLLMPAFVDAAGERSI